MTRKPTIGYMMRAFPVLYHATVLNEIRVMQEMGYPIRVFSILEPDPGEHRGESADPMPPVTYCWTRSARAGRSSVIKANLSILVRVGLGVYRRAFELAWRGGLLGNWRAFMRLAHRADEMRRQGVTHLHAHWATEGTTAALIFSWLTRLPFSFTAHAYDIFRSPQFLELKLREARFVVTVSKYNKQYIAQHFGPDAADKIHVIYPLIDLSQFSLRLPSADEPLTIVTVGRLTESKGLIYLVEACRILKERGIKLVCQIVGQGEAQPMLEEAIVRYGLESEVKLLGALPHDAIPPLLEKATIFALPCLIADDGNRDGMPLVLIEAMARGVPVVSSDILGLPELVRDGAGLLVPPHNPAALADALQHIAQLSPAEREAMGQAGRRIIEDFDAVKGTTRLLELIHSVSNDRTASLSIKKTTHHVTPTL